MSIDRSSSKTPILNTTREFYAKDTLPCIEEEYGFQTWYHGTGLPASQHPDERHIPTEEVYCNQCGSPEVLMIAWQWCVHPFSGDQYYDGEVWCPNCQSFTAFSFAEN